MLPASCSTEVSVGVVVLGRLDGVELDVFERSPLLAVDPAQSRTRRIAPELLLPAEHVLVDVRELRAILDPRLPAAE